jgi:uncharacterized Fe-S center protein
MKSDVYFANVRARSDKENKITKIGRLFDAAVWPRRLKKEI